MRVEIYNNSKSRLRISNNGSINSKLNQNNISFGKDKIFFYSDFDRTLSPLSTNDILDPDNHQDLINNAKRSFDIFSKLLKKYKDKFNLFITTGRTNEELKMMYNLYKNLGIKFPKASSVIIKNGSDEFLYEKQAKKEGDREYPFLLSNSIRNINIELISKWNKTEIENKAKEILKEENLEPLDCITSLSARRYGEISVFKNPKEIKDNNVLFRKFGALKLFLGFNSKINQEKIYMCRNKLVNYLENKNIPYCVDELENDPECGNFHTFTFSPIVNNNKLSKSYDTVKRLKEAILEEDKVIVAGDGSNDFDMLNPVNYIEKLPLNLDRNNLDLCIDYVNKNNDCREYLKKMPFLGIYIDKGDVIPLKFRRLIELFGENSEYKKIIVVKEGKLADKVNDIVNSFYK